MFISILLILIPYIIAIFAHIPISGVVQELWTKVGIAEEENEQHRPFAWTASIVGIVERCLYVVSLQVGKPEFIVIWLGIKTAGNWKTWTEGINKEKKKVDGRTVFAITLIGNGLSIAYAAVAWQMREGCLQSIIMLIALVLGTIALWCYIGYAKSHWGRRPLFNKIIGCFSKIFTKSKKKPKKKTS